MPDIHLKFSPSGASRWLSCPGSLHLPASEDSGSSYAAEGTAAHALVHRCFLLGLDAIDFPGKEVEGYEVTQEMAEGVQLYLDTVEAEANKLGGAAQTALEKFVTHHDAEEFGGTVDCAMVNSDCLTIVDFKYGAGVGVDAIGNPQLLSYATLVLSNLVVIPPKVRLIVVQPRFIHEDGPVRVWEPSDKELQEFEASVFSVMNLTKEESEFQEGSHCRWCPAKANCPELQRISLEAAEKTFNGMELIELDDSGTEIATLMTVELAAKIHDQRKAVETYFKAVEAWIYEQMEDGVEVPGLKMVEKRGKRKWDLSPEEILRKFRNSTHRLGKKDIFEEKLRSPAQLEKLTSKGFVSQFCSTPTTGTTVVPESDKRKAIETKSLAETFESIDDAKE